MKKTLLMMIAFMGIATIFSSCSKEEEEPPIADFYIYETEVEMGEDVLFYDKSSGEVASYSWSFPGGTPETSTKEDPVVKYKSSGYYSVTLTVTNEGGSDKITKEEVIHVLAGPPSASFSASSNVVNAGEEIILTDESAGEPTSWMWTISGPGTYEVYTTQDISFTPSEIGFYDVTLLVENEHGFSEEEKESFFECYAPGITIYNNSPAKVNIEHENEDAIQIDANESIKIYDQNGDQSVYVRVTTVGNGEWLGTNWEHIDVSGGDEIIDFNISGEYYHLTVENTTTESFNQIVINEGLTDSYTIDKQINSAYEGGRPIGYFRIYSNSTVDAHFSSNNQYIRWYNFPWSSMGSQNIELHLTYDGSKSTITQVKSDYVSKATKTLLLK